MILVDTSALIDFLRGRDNDPARKLRQVLEQEIPFGITSVVFQEVLQGAANEKEFHSLKSYLETQRFFYPKDPLESYAQAARLYFQCRRKGITVRSTIDCLIAQIAREHDLALLHNDRDMDALAQLAGIDIF
jgi:predicted nucleic acid-binding protein